MIQEYHRDNFLISTDPDRLDLDTIHHYLAHESYWAQGVARETVARSLAHSLCFGVYDGDQQIGLARVITDHATFAYVADVFILEAYRGQGLGKWLVECLLAHPECQGLRKWTLDTEDAHGLYEPFGFQPAPPGKHMVFRPGNRQD